MKSLVHTVIVAALITGAAEGATRSAPTPARFVCNAAGRCFEDGELDRRQDRAEDRADEGRTDRHHRHRHEGDIE